MNYRRISTEMKSLFFSLMKRTKNQGCGMVVKAQISNFFWRFSLRALYFVRSRKADFVGDFCEASDKSLAFKFVHKTQQSQGQRWFWIVIYDLWMKLIFLNNRRCTTEMESLFFCLIKRTKNQGGEMVMI